MSTKEGTGVVRRSDESHEISAADMAIYRDVEAIRERGKTQRTCVVSVACVVGIGIIGWTLRAFIDTPAWVQALGLIIGTGPAQVALWRMRGQFRMFMQKDHDRVLVLEGRIDASRASSGVKPDGSCPLDT